MNSTEENIKQKQSVHHELHELKAKAKIKAKIIGTLNSLNETEHTEEI